MKQFAFILITLLILWIAGSSYWYVCRIRGDCKKASPTLITPDVLENVDQAKELALKTSVEQAKTYLINSGIQTVYFEPYAITPSMNAISDEYSEKLKLYLDYNPEAKVMVMGHTDTSGPRAGNIKLSESRTEYIRTYLINAGINPNQIEAISKVDTEPASPNNTPEGRAKNRRAEIKF